MKYLTRSALCLSLLLISACSSYSLKTNRTAFYNPTYYVSGSIFVIATNPEQNNSLEFAYYKKKIEAKLAVIGYTIASNKNEADFMAMFTYGIDDGNTSIISSPIFASSSDFYDDRGLRSPSQRYSMPSYRMVGTSTDSITTYNIAIALDIIQASPSNTDSKQDVKKVYESRVKSVSSCGAIVGVFDQLLQAMFNNFPGENGKTITAKIPYKEQC